MNATAPPANSGIRLCLTVTKQGVTAYGNRAAFECLSDRLKSLASSGRDSHYEFHTIWHLGSGEKAYAETAPKDVYVLFSKATESVFHSSDPHSFGFELTFMMASDDDLNTLAQYQQTSLLPETWDETERILDDGCRED
jgi:hypothetical protein